MEKVNTIGETKKFITISELKEMGYSYYKIGQLEDCGFLSRVNRSTFENLSYSGDENDFFSAEAYVPDGVICLLSAARYYELTNYLPDAVDVAESRRTFARRLRAQAAGTIVRNCRLA